MKYYLHIYETKNGKADTYHEPASTEEEALEMLVDLIANDGALKVFDISYLHTLCVDGMKVRIANLWNEAKEKIEDQKFQEELDQIRWDKYVAGVNGYYNATR